MTRARAGALPSSVTAVLARGGRKREPGDPIICGTPRWGNPDVRAIEAIGEGERAAQLRSS